MRKEAGNPLKGMAWMVVTGLCFVVMTGLVKALGPRIPAVEQAFIRYLLGLVFLLPMWRQLISLRLSGRQIRLVSLRAVAHTGAVALWFFAMTRIPLAEVTAMNYLNPVYVTLLAVLFLGERLALRRLLAIGAALAGAMIILRPGFRELDVGHFAMLLTALCFGVSYLLAKVLVDEIGPSLVVALMSVTVAVGLAPLAIPVWVWPTGSEVLVLFLIACLATGGHYAMTLAFASAPMTVTQPVTFLTLIWSVSLGYFVFDEAVDIWVIIGGGVILSSVVYITWREAILKKAVTPAAMETKS
ncbi:MAG: DMT family transporter [Pelagimonas sp.]|nr:DMT family transporter [Pelagimonas sp.]